MKEKCETCEWRSSEIGYASRCPAHEIKPVSSLKQFQEKGGKEVDNMFIVGNMKFSGLNNNKLTPQSLKLFLSQQTSLAYELGKKEMLEMVLKGIEEEDKRWNSNGEFYANVRESLDYLKEKLLALNEE